MKPCTICGNDIGDSVWKCPYCEQQQTGSPTEPARRLAVVTIDLERGKPIVAVALRRLQSEIQQARMDRGKILRVIHGWGSSGVGGGIKSAVHKQLQSMLRAKKIRGYLPGDGYSEYANAGAGLLARHPSLKTTLRTDRENPGLTFVEL